MKKKYAKLKIFMRKSKRLYVHKNYAKLINLMQNILFTLNLF